MDKEDLEFNTGATTLPDYQNVRNIMLSSFQILNKSIINFRLCRDTEYKYYLREVKRAYLDFFVQINDKSKLSNLSKEHSKYLKYYYKYPEKINRKNAYNILVISRNLVNEYGIFNLESNVEDYR